MTPAQLQTLRTAIDADPTLAAQPRTEDGAFAIASAFNANASPAFFVWATAVGVEDIFDKIIWANLTPSGTPGTDAAWSNRALACQGRQLNLQTLLVGQSVIDGSRASIRNGLQDALTDIPSGANGALRQGGWSNVQIALTRRATRGEQLFANVTNGNGAANTTPATLTFEGQVSTQDVIAARNL